MTIRTRVHTWRRRRRFARILRDNGFTPTRWQLDLLLRNDLDQPRKRP